MIPKPKPYTWPAMDLDVGSGLQVTSMALKDMLRRLDTRDGLGCRSCSIDLVPPHV